MPGACLSFLPSEQCEWSTWDIWRSADVIERAIYISFGLMLIYTLLVVVRFICVYFSAGRKVRDAQGESGPDFERKSVQLISGLIRGLGILRGIGNAAPFLGLAGTSYGILAALSLWGSFSKASLFFYIYTQLPLKLTNAVVGILVALPALLSHNVARKWLEDHTGRTVRKKSCFEFVCQARTLPLRMPFSSLPHFAVIATPVFACFLMFWMALPYLTASGLPVALPSANCDYLSGRRSVLDRVVVLRIANSGQAFINMEPEDWRDLPHLLGEIYRSRQEKVLYVLAEDDVPFQTVADAIDIARNSPAAGPGSLDIKILLVTPMTSRDCALVPIRIIPTKKSSKG